MSWLTTGTTAPVAAPTGLSHGEPDSRVRAGFRVSVQMTDSPFRRVHRDASGGRS
jgi:hypothetical protein